MCWGWCSCIILVSYQTLFHNNSPILCSACQTLIVRIYQRSGLVGVSVQCHWVTVICWSKVCSAVVLAFCVVGEWAVFAITAAILECLACPIMVTHKMFVSSCYAFVRIPASFSIRADSSLCPVPTIVIFGSLRWSNAQWGSCR